MRAAIWDWAWYEENDDLHSFEPVPKAVRELLPEPRLPASAVWREESYVHGVATDLSR